MMTAVLILCAWSLFALLVAPSIGRMLAHSDQVSQEHDRTQETWRTDETAATEKGRQGAVGHRHHLASRGE